MIVNTIPQVKDPDKVGFFVLFYSSGFFYVDLQQSKNSNTGFTLETHHLHEAKR